MDNIYTRLPLNQEQMENDLYGYMSALVRELEKTILDLSLRDYDGEQLLSRTLVSFAEDGDTNLYTVPPEHRCIVTRVVVVAAADCGATTISIGQDGAEADAISLRTLSGVDAQYDSAILSMSQLEPPVKTESYAPGTVIQARVAAHAGAADNTVLLYGVLY